MNQGSRHETKNWSSPHLPRARLGGSGSAGPAILWLWACCGNSHHPTVQLLRHLHLGYVQAQNHHLAIGRSAHKHASKVWNGWTQKLPQVRPQVSLFFKGWVPSLFASWLISVSAWLESSQTSLLGKTGEYPSWRFWIRDKAVKVLPLPLDSLRKNALQYSLPILKYKPANHHKCLQNELMIRMHLVWYEVLSLLCRFPLLFFLIKSLKRQTRD